MIRRIALVLALLGALLLAPDAAARETDSRGSGWPHFLRVHVEQRRADTRVIVDAKWAGARWFSQQNVPTGDYLVRVDQSGFVKSMDAKLAFFKEPIATGDGLDVFVQFPAVHGADRFSFRISGSYLEAAGTAIAGRPGNAVIDTRPYQPHLTAPLDFEIHAGEMCRSNQYLQISPEWTRILYRTPPGTPAGLYRARLNVDGTVSSLDGKGPWVRTTAPQFDWDHQLVAAYIIHACDPAGDGSDVAGWDRHADNTFTHMTTWQSGPDNGYGFQPWGDLSTQPRESFAAGNYIVVRQPDTTPPLDLSPRRLRTAVAASQARFAAADSAKGAVLARVDQFADALAGIPLATAKGGPLLVTGRDGLDPAVGDELARVLPQGGTVHLLGGDDALSPAVADAVRARGLQVVRVAGATRVETAVAVADIIGPANVAMIVNAWNFPDALAAGAASGAAGATHILLTDAGGVPAVTAAKLQQGGYAHRIVFGGTHVVSDGAARGVAATERLAGETRVGTSVAAARRFRPTATAVWLADGGDYVGGLVGGAMAAAGGGPLLLTTGGLDDDLRSYLLGATPTTGYATGSIPDGSVRAVFTQTATG